MATKSKGGRPRKYGSSVVVSFRAEAAELDELRAFAHWRSFREGRDISLGEAVLGAVRDSRAFRAFTKARQK